MPTVPVIPMYSRLLLVVGLSFLSRPVDAQAGVIQRPEFSRLHAKAAIANPDGVKALIRFDGGRHVFHVGEYIASTYALVGNRADLITPPDGWYENPPDKDYVIDNPEGVVRPDQIFPPNLGDSFHFGIFSYWHQQFIYYKRRINLNRHLRFTRPGHYRIYLTLGLPMKSIEPERTTSKYIDLVSEITDLEILPEDAGISQVQIQGSLDILEFCHKEHLELPACTSHNHPSKAELKHYAEVITACDVVNYQNTQLSALTQLKFLFSAANDNCSVVRGLEETSYVDLVLTALTHRFHDATVLPSQQELYLAARLDAIRAGRASYSWKTVVEAKTHYCAMLASTLPERSGKNKADALVAIVITLDVEGLAPSEKMEPVLRNLMDHFAEELVPVMSMLDAETMFTLLEDRWARMKNPVLLPALEQFAQTKTTAFSPQKRALLEQRIQELRATKTSMNAPSDAVSVSGIK